MRIYERIIKSPGAPTNTADLWLDTKQNPPALKCFHGNEWVSIASVSGGGEVDLSEDSDVVLYSDFLLFTIDPDKPTIIADGTEFSFYPDERAVQKGTLALSGGTVIIDAQSNVRRLTEIADREGAFMFSTSEQSFIVTTVSRESVPVIQQQMPNLNVTGPGFVLMTKAEESE